MPYLLSFKGKDAFIRSKNRCHEDCLRERAIDSPSIFRLVAIGEQPDCMIGTVMAPCNSNASIGASLPRLTPSSLELHLDAIA